MKIVLATNGPLGDVQPMLALALGLKMVGHEVFLAATPRGMGKKSICCVALRLS